MVRHRLHQTITLGRFNDGLKWARDMNEVARKNGWVESRLMAPGYGAFNQLILETEYPDHASLHKELEAFQTNTEAMAAFRRGTELVAPGTHPWDEVEEEVPQELELA
jgi:hypothetical protein